MNYPKPLPGGEFLPEPEDVDILPEKGEQMNDPLWMPKGSVRSILALLMVAPVMGRYALTGAVPDPQLLLLIGGVAAAYGIGRTVGK